MKIRILNHKNLINLKKNNQRIVLCHGVFDLVHIGHIKHFEEAKENGDVLVVSVTSDKFVNKGPGRPIYNDKGKVMKGPNYFKPNLEKFVA